MAILSDNVLFDWAALTVGVLTVIYFVLTRNFNHWKNKGVPFVKPNVFLGNCKKLFFLEISPGQFLEELYEQGAGHPYIGFFIFGRPALVIRDPEIIKTVLIKDFNYFSERHADTPESVDPVGSKSLFLMKGHKWKHMRTKLSPIFTSGKMKQMFDLINECAEQLQTYIITSNGKIQDVKELMANFTTDVISSCAFGINTNSIMDSNAEFRKFGRKSFDFTIPRALEILSIFFVPSFGKLFKFQFLSKEATDFLRVAFWDALTYREEKKVIRKDMLDILIKLKNDSGISDTATVNIMPKEGKTVDLAFTKDEIVAQAAQFFAAGFETTASTLSFTLYELALNQEYQRKLRQELADWLKESDGKITYEMVHGMKYLDMVISETLRKYPPVTFIDRNTQHDYTIAATNITIKKDTPVFIPVLGLHNDPQYFPDPTRYDPERFNDANRKAITPSSYIPFGDGPRNCIGQRFGLMSAKTGLLYILSKFEVQRSRNTPNQLEIQPRAVITATVGGIPLTFVNSDITV